MTSNNETTSLVSVTNNLQEMKIGMANLNEHEIVSRTNSILSRYKREIKDLEDQLRRATTQELAAEKDLQNKQKLTMDSKLHLNATKSNLLSAEANHNSAQKEYDGQVEIARASYLHRNASTTSKKDIIEKLERKKEVYQNALTALQTLETALEVMDVVEEI